MEFRKFLQNKLWRDKAEEMLARHGSRVESKRLSDNEFEPELKNKLREEVEEVFAAKNKEEILEECADVLEVLLAFGAFYGFSFEEIVQVQQKKHEERGGFMKRIFVTHVYHQVDSWGERYCLKAPEKYPEVVDGLINDAKNTLVD